MERSPTDAVYPPIVHAASAYVPADLRQAMADGVALPERTQGAALFADISGFTPLTEALTQTMGLRRGAEELARHLNRVYDALIGEVNRYGGSVISFAGDAITCWFAAEIPEGSVETPALRAAACALVLQQVMQQFAAVSISDREPVRLAVKVAIASGPARRFVIGDPAFQRMAVLAGETVVRMATAEHLAAQGDVVVDAHTTALLGDRARVADWRMDEDTGERFAVLDGLLGEVASAPWPHLGPEDLTEEQVRPYLLAAVHARLRVGLGEFLTELRPAVVLFMCFEGIDYDDDEAAGPKLDAYIRWVQRVMDRYDGTLSQLIVGDKGSYLYAAFGAPTAHEDDSQRAVAAALALRTPPVDMDFIQNVQIGISQGTTRTGAYGGTMRRTYGILGDEVNVAARLMQYAGPGDVIVSPHVRRDAAGDFLWDPLPPIRVKGKREPLAVARLVGQRVAQPGGAGQLRAYTSPLVGREAERAQLRSILQRVLVGKGQILRLVGATGIGKSHLAAVFAMDATQQGARVHVGVCQSITQHLAYAAWRPIFRSLLGLVDGPARGQLGPGVPSTEPSESQGQEETTTTSAHHIARLQAALDQLNPEWRIRLPLLGDLLDLPIPDNATTAAFDPHLRQQALHTMAVDLVQAYASDEPLLLLIEDAHWMDEASLALALALGRVVDRSPVLLMLVQRPPIAQEGVPLPDLNQLPGYHQLDLGELSPDSVATLIGHKLQVPVSEVSGLALSLVQAQAQGNPCFAEEMVDALRETEDLIYLAAAGGEGEGVWTLSDALIHALRGANSLARDPASGEWMLSSDAQLSAASLDLPNSIHRTVLSRLDRLPEPHKLSLKVASVIGPVFEIDVLLGTHPARPDQRTLEAQLETFVSRNFVQPLLAPQATYMFRHNVSQEVVYDTVPWEQQRALHRSVGMVLETRHPEGGGRSEAVEQLAYHFSRGGEEARDKAMFYLDGAARKAQRQQANQTALNYYDQALALEERWQWRRGQTRALHVLGRREEEQAALRTLEAMSDAPAYDVAHLWGQYHEAMSDYPQAQAAVERALSISREWADRVSEANGLAQLGLIVRRQGDYEGAKGWYAQALALFHGEATSSLEESLALVQALNGLGIIHRQQGDFDQAKARYERALALSRQSGNRAGEAEALNSLGVTVHYQRHLDQALGHYRQAIEIRRAIGDRAGEATTLFNLAVGIKETGDYSRAEVYMSEALSIHQAMGNKWEEVNVWIGLGILYLDLGNLPRAWDCLNDGLQLSRVIGDEAGQAYLLVNLGLVARDRGDLQAAEDLLVDGLALAEAQDDKYLISAFTTYLSSVHLILGRYEQAIEQANAALALRREIDQRLNTADNLATLAAAHLAKGDLDKALDDARQALAILDECGGEGPEFPQQDYFMCYQVLQADGQKEAARKAMQSAYELVMRLAEKITDRASRQSFLERVPMNRQVIQEVRATQQ